MPLVYGAHIYIHLISIKDTLWFEKWNRADDVLPQCSNRFMNVQWLIWKGILIHHFFFSWLFVNLPCLSICLLVFDANFSRCNHPDGIYIDRNMNIWKLKRYMMYFGNRRIMYSMSCIRLRRVTDTRSNWNFSM